MGGFWIDLVKPAKQTNKKKNGYLLYQEHAGCDEQKPKNPQTYLNVIKLLQKCMTSLFSSTASDQCKDQRERERGGDFYGNRITLNVYNRNLFIHKKRIP